MPYPLPITEVRLLEFGQGTPVAFNKFSRRPRFRIAETGGYDFAEVDICEVNPATKWHELWLTMNDPDVNLVTNPEFQNTANGNEGWTLAPQAGQTIEVKRGCGYVTPNALHVLDSSASAETNAYQDIAVSPSDVISAQTLQRKVSGTPQFKIAFLDAGKAILVGYEYTVNNTATGWAQLKIQNKTAPALTAYVRVWPVFFADVATGEGYADAVQVEKASACSGYGKHFFHGQVSNTIPIDGGLRVVAHGLCAWAGNRLYHRLPSVTEYQAWQPRTKELHSLGNHEGFTGEVGVLFDDAGTTKPSLAMTCPRGTVVAAGDNFSFYIVCHENFKDEVWKRVRMSWRVFTWNSAFTLQLYSGAADFTNPQLIREITYSGADMGVTQEDDLDLALTEAQQQRLLMFKFVAETSKPAGTIADPPHGGRIWDLEVMTAATSFTVRDIIYDVTKYGGVGFVDDSSQMANPGSNITGFAIWDRTPISEYIEEAEKTIPDYTHGCFDAAKRLWYYPRDTATVGIKANVLESDVRLDRDAFAYFNRDFLEFVDTWGRDAEVMRQDYVTPNPLNDRSLPVERVFSVNQQMTDAQAIDCADRYLAEGCRLKTIGSPTLQVITNALGDSVPLYYIWPGYVLEMTDRPITGGNLKGYVTGVTFDDENQSAQMELDYDDRAPEAFLARLVRDR